MHYGITNLKYPLIRNFDNGGVDSNKKVHSVM